MKLLEFARNVLEKSDTPLSYKQIWQHGVSNGLDKQLDYKGKTDPWMSIYAAINQDITTKDNSDFCKLSKNPVLFGLTNKEYTDQEISKGGKAADTVAFETKETENATGDDYSEADLHPVLVKFVAGDSHFQCLTKTIAQQKAKKKTAGLDEWTYPDLIGVYFPYKDYKGCTVNSLSALKINAIKLFSFEMKKDTLCAGNIRSYYFQAVSNSSWASEGYLVAPNVSNDSDFLQELALLNNAFGIGIIKLNISEPAKSEILFPARQHNEIDANMLNKLIDRSDEVKSVFEVVAESEKIAKVSRREIFDPVLSDEDYQQKTKNGIKGLVERKK